MSLFQRFSSVSRARKFTLFQDLMRPAPTTRVLDVGAEIEPGDGQEQQFLDRYPWKEALSALNIAPEYVRAIQERYPTIDARTGDARQIPWPDKYFDIVWSNAVIEHVGRFEDQQQMAREIMRVGKRWFVTTPNRWYPYEFHLRLPLVTWLPCHGYLWCGRLVRYSHVTQRYIWGAGPAGIRLLSPSELAHCFPGSRIVKQRVTFMPETLIAVGGEMPESPEVEKQGSEKRECAHVPAHLPALWG